MKGTADIDLVRVAKVQMLSGRAAGKRSLGNNEKCYRRLDYFGDNSKTEATSVIDIADALQATLACFSQFYPPSQFAKRAFRQSQSKPVHKPKKANAWLCDAPRSIAERRLTHQPMVTSEASSQFINKIGIRETLGTNKRVLLSEAQLGQSRHLTNIFHKHGSN